GALWIRAGGLGRVTTEEYGQSTLSLAAGSNTLIANDSEHAPGRSVPVTVADKPVTNVEIVMKAGGVLAGTVVDSAHQPVAFATLRVAGKDGNMWLVAQRQATTDRAGKFELRGLARVKLEGPAAPGRAALQP